MPIVFRCDHCGARFAAPDQLAGKPARCQACKTVVTVPNPARPATPPPPVPQAPKITPAGPAVPAHASGPQAVPAHVVPAVAAPVTPAAPRQPTVVQSRPQAPAPSLLTSQPTADLLEAMLGDPLRPRTAKQSHIGAKWILGGSIGLATAIITVAIALWMNSNAEPAPVLAQAHRPPAVQPIPNLPTQPAASSGAGSTGSDSSWWDWESLNPFAKSKSSSNPDAGGSPPASRTGANMASAAGQSTSSHGPYRGGNSAPNGSFSGNATGSSGSTSGPYFGPTNTDMTSRGGSGPRVRAPQNFGAPFGPLSSDSGTSDTDEVPPQDWSLEPDPLAAPVELKEGTLKIPLAGPMPQIVFPRGHSRFVLAWNGDNSRPECLMYDLKTAQPIGKMVQAYGLVPKDALVSSDGRYVAMVRDETSSQKHRIRITTHSFATGGQMPRIDFECGDFYTALWGPAHHLLTAHSQGERFSSTDHVVTLWNVQTGEKASEIRLASLPLDQQVFLKQIAVSPGGKYMAIPTQSEIAFVDLERGSVLATSPIPPAYRGESTVVFSPDGRLLACINDRFEKRLRVIDLATGVVTVNRKITSARSYNVAWDQASLTWLPDNRGLLVDGQIMIELTSAEQAWQFARPGVEQRRIFRDGEMVTLGVDRTKFYISSVTLPQRQIAQVFDALRTGGAAVDIALPPIKQVDLGLGPQVSPPTSPVDWAYVPDPTPIQSRTGQCEFQVTDPFSSLLAIRFASAAERVIVHRLPSEGQSLLDVYDSSGKKQLSHEIPREYRLIDVSPSGRRALIGVEQSGGRWDRLDCISLEAKQHIAGWRPYSQETASSEVNRADHVAWASFIDDDHVLTDNAPGKLACWRLPDCQPMYVYPRFGQALAVSGGRRYLLGSDGVEIRVIEAISGQCVGQLTGVSSIESIAGGTFRADGGEIAISLFTGRDSMLVRWNANTGQIIDQAPTRFAETVEYCGSDYLILGGHRLFDVRNRRVVWQYVFGNGGQRVAHTNDSRTWYAVGRTTQDGARHLVSYETPSEATKLKTAPQRFESQFALRPGEGVRISVDLPSVGLEDLQPEIERQLGEAVTARGFVVNPSAGTTLTLAAAERTTGPQSTMIGPAPFDSRGAPTMEERDLVYHLTLSDAAGNVMWGVDRRIVMPPITSPQAGATPPNFRERLLGDFRGVVRSAGGVVSSSMPDYTFFPAASRDASVLGYHEELPPTQSLPDALPSRMVTQVRPSSTFPRELSVNAAYRANGSPR